MCSGKKWGVAACLQANPGVVPGPMEEFFVRYSAEMIYDRWRARHLRVD